MRDQFLTAPYNHLIKQINYLQHYQKVKNTTFDKFFRCMAYLGFNCIKITFIYKSYNLNTVFFINFLRQGHQMKLILVAINTLFIIFYFILHFFPK